MKLLILVAFLSSAYCLEISDQDGVENIENKEILKADGSDYGGYLSFQVKGKIDNENDEDAKDIGKDVSKDNYTNYNSGYIGPQKDGKKDRDDNLGYRTRGYCIGENRYRDGNLDNKNSFYMDDDVKARCDKMFGFTGPTANDEPENLIRPCALNDWQCIRKYFAANSNCKPAYGPIPDPLFVDVNTAFFTLANLTVALTNMTVRGLSSAKINEFYVNKESGNLVLALDVRNLNLSIPRAYLRYRRTAKESIVLADFGTVNFRSATLTAVIPNIPHLRLDLADIHADIQSSTPHIIGPGAANSTDPDVITALAEFNLFLPISIIEGALFQGQLFTAIYIQANICDFGLKLVSV